MEDITREYTYLFNTVTDIRRRLAELCEELALAQMQAEEIFISRGETAPCREELREAG